MNRLLLIALASPLAAQAPAVRLIAARDLLRTFFNNSMASAMAALLAAADELFATRPPLSISPDAVVAVVSANGVVTTITSAPPGRP
jgi:hypothetical protein